MKNMIIIFMKELHPSNFSIKQNYSSFITIFMIVGFTSIYSSTFAQAPDAALPVDSLKKLSIEELLNIDITVTSVSKRPEKLTEAPSSIQVITQQDIRNSGATNIPEALRLATNLQVAQVNSSQWAISARGFNNVLANKLLVLIDGRVVYTPMYAGVFWDIQNVVLADVEHIEVISGPGGTLWGTNSVNGVINIITKSSKETSGSLIQGAAGTELLSSLNLRYGGKLGKNIYYRAYGSAFKRGSTYLNDSINPHDAWTMGLGGLRIDWEASTKNKISLQTNIYDGRPDPDGDSPVIASGGNINARWNHVVSEKNDYQLQAYYDQTWRDFGNGFSERLSTYDIDWQNRFRIGKRHEIVWGAGLRLMDHNVDTLELFAFIPPRKLLHIYSAFIQDKFIIIKDRLNVAVGSKFEHNTYTGFQYQPSIRLSYTRKKQSMWAAATHAVRTPARIDREFVISLAPGIPYLEGSSSFKSEQLTALELGWRIQPIQKIFFSASTFYNFYDNLRSVEPGPNFAPLNIPITFSNGVKGETYGLELSATYQVTRWWHLRGGYTYLRKHLWVKANSSDLNQASAESNDPKYQYLIQSSMTLHKNIELGAILRYVDHLPKPFVSSYTELDLRLGWKINKIIELDVVGQNLLNSRHLEFIPSNPAPRQIQRSVYGKITVRF